MKGKVTISIDEYEELKKPKLIGFGNVEFVCPLCNHKNSMFYEEFPRGKNKKIIYCDLESGGCDEEIVLISDLICKLNVKAVKIGD